MKELLIYLTVLGLTSISTSCEENFSPKSDFIQQYALYCIIKGDTSYQYAIVEKSFDAEGLNPSSIKGAKIKIRYNDADYPLRDTSSIINDTTLDFYYTDILEPEPGKLMDISAELPDGSLLSANTVTPKSNNISFQFENIVSDTYIEEKSGGLFFIWQLSGEDSSSVLYLPALKINYYETENGESTLHHKEIPVSYFSNGNEYLPNYPVITSENMLNYEMDAINRAMREISGEDPIKSNYSIIDANFELLILDNNLAPYFSTIQTFLDSYTVILDQQEYSNIRGGYGVFGSFFKRVLKLSLSSDYVLSFGYRLAD